jgi:hypothetical protein
MPAATSRAARSPTSSTVNVERMSAAPRFAAGPCREAGGLERPALLYLQHPRNSVNTKLTATEKSGTMTKEPKRKTGRPSTGLDIQMMLRVSAEWLETIDEWRDQQPDKPPRAVAIRRLVERGLKYRGK